MPELLHVNIMFRNVGSHRLTFLFDRYDKIKYIHVQLYMGIIAI